MVFRGQPSQHVWPVRTDKMSSEYLKKQVSDLTWSPHTLVNPTSWNYRWMQNFDFKKKESRLESMPTSRSDTTIFWVMIWYIMILEFTWWCDVVKLNLFQTLVFRFFFLTAIIRALRIYPAGWFHLNTMHRYLDFISIFHIKATIYWYIDYRKNSCTPTK